MPLKEPSFVGQIVVYSWLYDSSIRTYCKEATPVPFDDLYDR